MLGGTIWHQLIVLSFGYKRKKNGNPAFIGLESGAWKAIGVDLAHLQLGVHDNCSTDHTVVGDEQFEHSRWAIIVAKNVPWLGPDVVHPEEPALQTRAATFVFHL